ncbi:MAG: DNA cytosine methyltransferase [Prevotella sp.]|nr:DNA cytosine methyltransferase [Prevotella sp.]
MQPTFIDLFSGCGGMSLGFEMAGFKSILAIDNWNDALITYAYNRKNPKTLCADLLNLSPYEVEKTISTNIIDVIIGGPPCQGFSVAGKRVVEDERNKLYKSFVNMVRHFKPQGFVMENVPNILSIGNGIIKESILSDFSNLGYNVVCRVMLASDYGVPQNRRRAVFVGLRNGIYAFPDKKVTNPVTSSEALSDLPETTVKDGAIYKISPQSPYQKIIRKNSHGIYNHEITIHTEQTKRIIAMVPDGGNYKNLPKELWNMRKVHIAWTRLNSKKPSFTIDCGHNHHFHYKYNRVPTVRESARLQSFPDSFVFIGGKGSQLKQVGNAVPPLMAYQIALSLIKYLK